MKRKLLHSNTVHIKIMQRTSRNVATRMENEMQNPMEIKWKVGGGIGACGVCCLGARIRGWELRSGGWR